MKRILLFAIAAMALAGCATKLPPLPEAQAGPYRLGPGDEVRVDFYRLTELSNTYVVNDTGRISVPLIQPVVASGKTIVELEEAIEVEIKANNLLRNPDVAAQVSKYRPFFIVGEVQHPGQYDYQPNMSVLVALSVAGGPTFRADTDDVVITRRLEGETITGRARPESLVMPGDTIEVKEGWF
jgi:polysaccharide export outer membrane protein